MKNARHILIILSILLLAGCSSSKIIAKQELIGAHLKHSDTLAKISVGVLPAENTPVEYQVERFISTLNEANIFKRVEVATRADKWPDILISNVQDVAPTIGDGFQCFEPYLLIVTVGVIPSTCKRTHAFSFEVSRPQSKKTIKVEEFYVEKDAAGWIAKGLTSSEDGKFSGSKIEYFQAVFNYYASQIEELLSSADRSPKNGP